MKDGSSTKVVGVCGICHDEIRVEVAEQELDPSLSVREAVEEHLATHSNAEIAGFHLRATVPLLPQPARGRAARALASALRRGAGDDDQVAVYSIEEALGSVEMYRLWLAAERQGAGPS